MAYDRDLADRLRALLADQPELTEKAMFGGLGFMVGGHLAVAAGSDGGLMVRCPPDETAELMGLPGAAPMIMRGREMAGWLRVGPTGTGTEAALAAWVQHGLRGARTLPPR